MHADTVAVLAEPPIKAKLDGLGLITVGSTPEALGSAFQGRDGEVGARDQGGQHQGQRMITRRRAIGIAATAVLTPGLVGRASAQTFRLCPPTWPTRTVRLIVPFAAGGSTDAMARIVANRLSEIWGQQMVVENRGGGGSNIGHEAVVRSEPDGYTVLIASLPLAVNRYLFRALTYDPIADLAPVTLICTYPNVMTVPNSSPAKSVMEFVAYAKANRGKDHLRLIGQRDVRSFVRRIVQAHGRDRDDACALSRRRTCD